MAYESGINVFDTSESYAGGRCAPLLAPHSFRANNLFSEICLIQCIAQYDYFE